MAQVARSPKTYDVCVIGSGAGGGMAAKILTEGGLSVAMLEAGPEVHPDKDFKMLMWPYELPHRGAGVGGHASENFSEFLAPNGAWNIDGEPYTSAPGANFQWFRSRIVGGRTNHWGRIALRFRPSISSLVRAMASATIGPSPTRTSRPTTTKWKATSVFSAPGKTSPMRPTGFSAAAETALPPNCSSRKPATS
jgi:choline dehydrogenase-like flavoprotein